MTQQVLISTLDEGSAFIADWRPEGKQIGLLLDKGIGSVGVKIPRLGGNGWEGDDGACRWSPNTMVIPASREVFNTQGGSSSSNRNRSAADNPVERVHAICTEMKSAKRDEIIARCVSEGINANTAKTQFYAWRKKQGQ